MNELQDSWPCQVSSPAKQSEAEHRCGPLREALWIGGGLSGPRGRLFGVGKCFCFYCSLLTYCWVSLKVESDFTPLSLCQEGLTLSNTPQGREALGLQRMRSRTWTKSPPTRFARVSSRTMWGSPAETWPQGVVGEWQVPDS